MPLEVDVLAIPDWEGFDKLKAFLSKEHSAETIYCADGPDARVCVLEVSGLEFELRYEHPYGNSIVATTPASENIVTEIGRDLEVRLKAIE
tara:strand:+ start:160 stop:432 length:273 start_codon:yes stop_codon:yes gene_type:complete